MLAPKMGLPNRKDVIESFRFLYDVYSTIREYKHQNQIDTFEEHLKKLENEITKCQYVEERIHTLENAITKCQYVEERIHTLENAIIKCQYVEEHIHTLESAITNQHFFIMLLIAGLVILITYILLRKH